MKQQRISGKEAARVAEDMAKPGPIRVVAASEAQEAPGALVPSPGSELDRKAPPRVRKPLPSGWDRKWSVVRPHLQQAQSAHWSILYRFLSCTSIRWHRSNRQCV